MRKNTMPGAKFSSRGFTLIASLLLVMLLSGFAIALLMMVNSEQRAGNNDLSNNYTYRAAEGAMEKMTSDLANTFTNIQSPTAGEICAVGNNPPTWDPTVTYSGAGGAYNVSPVNPGVSNPCAVPLPPPVWGPVQSGPDAGLYAQIIPVTMNVTAQRVLGNSETVSMTRTAEVALIPVFQYGVFSDSDLFFGQSPNLGFAGRVHTNGDLYLGVANGYNLVFGDKISAFGNVIREQMQNQFPVGGGWDQGTVMIPTTSGGCNTQMANVASANPSLTCVDISTTALGNTEGSVFNGHGSGQVGANWVNVSSGTPYQNYLIDGNGTPGPPPVNGAYSTGATDLTLPFVNTAQGVSAVQIIRRPLSTTSPTSLLGGSQLGYEAQIRVLLSDTQAGLHLADWNNDASQDIQLVGILPSALASLGQGASSGGSQAGAYNVNGSGHYYYFGESYCGGSAPNNGTVGSPCPTTSGGDSNFIIPKYYGPMSTFPPPSTWPPTAFPAPTTANFTTANGNGNGLEWPLINGWLRVEAKWASDGQWHGVTKEWLQLGFARGLNVPTKPGFGCTSPTTNTLTTADGCNYLQDHANAILYFQVTADRNLNGSTSGTDTPIVTTYYDGTNGTYKSQYNWYPINFYDAREGENNDTASYFTQGTGTPNGVMNAVELDVGNLKNWLAGKTGSTGSNVDFSTQNGYILYFSDRRGMQFATNCGSIACQWQYGEYGYEDTVNYVNSSNKFAPTGSLEPNNYNGVSPEDVNNNGVLDNYGVKGVGDAFGTNYTTDTDTNSPPSPFAQRLGLAERIPTTTVALANRVTGARHVLKLVDGALGNLPTMPPGNSTNNCSQSAANPTGCGGFTVGSENPVYILGNYNSNCPSAGGAGCTPTNTTYDPTWTSSIAAEPNHAAASIIADAVTMLSNNWQDWGCITVSATCINTGTGALQSYTGSLVNPINPGNANTGNVPNRFALTTYYRVAVAAGKTIAFSNVPQNPEFGFGTDGGVHNFLRFLEDWSGSSTNAGPQNQQQLYYKGSIVSLYWNGYATGSYKCCNLVYHPPDRQYTFDDLFSIPANLPPGTPMFRNVDNLSYRQNQIARTN
jgi:hypothetical protein